MHGHALIPALLLALLAAAAPRSGAATAVRLDVPGMVSAGQVVELRWSALPGDADEAELVLSLDGGRSWPVRVSPELEAREGLYRWRVPDLPADRARLALRVGGAAGERLAALSREFRIAHVAGAPAPELGFREGWLWIGLDAPDGRRPPGIGGEAPRLEDAADAAPCAPPAPPALVAPASGGRSPITRASVAPPPRLRAAGSAPREVPLRI